MQNLVSAKPYVPVPPHRGRIWPMLLARYVPRLLKRTYGVVDVECVHAERLRASIAAGHGVMLAPNHCRDEDPITLGVLSQRVGSPFFVMASAHLFVQTRAQTFLLRRAGAFSIYREGIDRTALTTAIEILERAERPLVIFPEGFIARTNDRLNELMDGVAMIGRSAARKRAALTPAQKVVVHPIALRYRFLGDLASTAGEMLDEIEARLSWRPHRHLPLFERILKVGTALLTLKEIEITGRAREGDIHERLRALIDALLQPLEGEWVEGRHDGSVNARVKRLRAAILPDLVKGAIDEAESARRWRQLADVYLAMQLAHYPPDYVTADGSLERFRETLERFEEDLTDRVRVRGPIAATITVGEPIEVSPERERRGAGDPLLTAIQQQLQRMLGLPDAALAAAQD